MLLMVKKKIINSTYIKNIIKKKSHPLLDKKKIINLISYNEKMKVLKNKKEFVYKNIPMVHKKEDDKIYKNI